MNKPEQAATWELIGELLPGNSRCRFASCYPPEIARHIAAHRRPTAPALDNQTEIPDASWQVNPPGDGVPTVTLPTHSRRWSRVGLAARAVRHKLRAATALGAFWPAVVRGGALLARGRFREFAGKLLNETATVRAADSAPVRSGPPLFLAGHLLRPGGYDHVVSAVLKGLLDAGVNVHRDPRAVLRPEHIPPAYRLAEARREATHPRLAATPPHLLRRFHPDRHTAAYTMWETDTLPSGAVAALNRCGLVIVPTQWGADCFRANGVMAPIEVVPLGHDPEEFRPAAVRPPDGCVFGTA